MKELILDFNKMGGLIPAIIQDAETRNVLMLGFMNQEAYEKTQETGHVTFWSRTRNCLWTKGETSGPTCHTGTDTCWGEDNEPAPTQFLTELQDYIDKRHEEMPEGSYTTSLFKKGISRIAQKVGEEALETVIEAVSGTDNKLKYEAADMLYHLIVLLTAKGMRIEDVVEELHKRHDPNWDAERRKAKAAGTMK